MDRNNLELLDERGFYSKIADFTVGDPVDEDGFKYRTLTLTAPFVRDVRTNAKLTVYDATDDEMVVTFTPESIGMSLRDENFVKVVGRLILAIPTNL